jgi:type VI protein secretion system component VasF
MPPPVEFTPQPGASVEEEWRMSSLGPPPPKRRIWLWVLIGIIALCLLVCVGIIGFSLTDTGQRWFEDLATEAAEQATEQAN